MRESRDTNASLPIRTCIGFRKATSESKAISSGSMCHPRTLASRCVAIASLSTHFEASLSDFRQRIFSGRLRHCASQPSMQSPSDGLCEWREARFNDFALHFDPRAEGDSASAWLRVSTEDAKFSSTLGDQMLSGIASRSGAPLDRLRWRRRTSAHTSGSAPRLRSLGTGASRKRHDPQVAGRSPREENERP
jgi:hypothetical protein